MAFVWTSALSVGVPEIDGQHQELVNRANQMLEAMKAGRGRAEVERLVEFLGEYALEHFGAEERRMQDARYPDLVAHKALHKAFVLDFGHMSADLQKCGATSEIVLSVHRRICDWLREHIQQRDREFGNYLREHARQAA